MQCHLTVKYLKIFVSIENLDDAPVIENHTNSGIPNGYKLPPTIKIGILETNVFHMKFIINLIITEN